MLKIIILVKMNKNRNNSPTNENMKKIDKASRDKQTLKLLSPDHELLVWEKWIQIRKEETTKLGEKLHRNPVDLAMNLSEKVREDLERKTAISLAQIEKKPTVRGTLFERPLRLKQRCYHQPVYEVKRTAAELGHPHIIEHIGVPTDIQKTELGMAGDTQRQICERLNADYVKYRQKREEELAENINKVDPFRPSTSNLIVQGFKPKPAPPKIPTPPTISVDAPSNFIEEAVTSIYALRINSTVFYKKTPGKEFSSLSMLQHKHWHEKCTSWSYYFNVPVNRAGRGKLFLHNLGTVTLRYCWKMIKKSSPFIPTDTFQQVFFFNKNEDILSPGQSRNICFTFVSDKPGIYSEFWELNFMNIYFFNTPNEKITFILHADSVENMDSIKKKVEILKNRIHKKAVSNLVNDIFNEIIDNVFANAPQAYPYKHYFLEAEIFVMKNPVCFYHQTEVEIMKELYSTEMTPGDSWDLSISSWRSIMMSKDYDNRMKYYDALKKSHSTYLKPWYEGDDLLQEKYCAIRELLGELANKLDSEYKHLTDLYIPEPLMPIDNNELFVPKNQQNISNIFFLHAYEHVATTIEQCAGILSSLDANRWIKFDFCRH